ncbi:FAD-dependent oxidoreductase [Nocardia sp. SC052]|uniref:FAD-dependent oxidoreductase n=1 Tax=Nocardia sichangensis TaxID=3385975 RepID=UPI0039A04F89
MAPIDVYEASSRVGGRIHTHRFGGVSDAPYVALRAMRVDTRCTTPMSLGAVRPAVHIPDVTLRRPLPLE